MPEVDALDLTSEATSILSRRPAVGLALGVVRNGRPATAQPRYDLLTHTAGISEQLSAAGLLRPDFGESVKAGRPLPTLAEYYRGGLRLDAEPGTRFRYTDHGPATLGQIVEDVSGQPLARYLRECVFEPLGMTSSELVRSDRLRARLATGYRLGSQVRAPSPIATWCLPQPGPRTPLQRTWPATSRHCWVSGATSMAQSSSPRLWR